jgi:signal transduction histidine kinase
MTSVPRGDTSDSAELERALDSVDHATAGASFPGTQRCLARTRAEVLFNACGQSSDAIPLAQLSYAAELLLLVAVDLAAEPSQAQRMIGRLDQQARVPRVALGREVLQSGRLLGLPVDVAIEVRIAFLLAFTGATTVSLWTATAAEVKLAAQAGPSGDQQDGVRELAARLLAAHPSSAPAPTPLAGVRLERLRPPPAALVLEGMTATAEEGELLLAAAGPVVAALLDGQAPAVREAPSQENLLESVQRRLTRLRFDLHDGPQQDVHLLAQDLALFREQLRPMISGDPNAARLLGRLDDLEAQLVALDGDLRRLSTAVQSPLLVPGSLPEALRAVTEAFAARTAVVPEVRFSGNLSGLTDSQQIALLSLIREALSNIRQHSEAQRVQITIATDTDGVRVEIRDDGKGFDPEKTLVTAARAGRLGLVGMHERVRMLGGVTQIDSSPGGGTVISAALPPWPGDEGAAASS